ncbi:MAG: hypothetical protein BIFFINMI_04198 [Phycisphaerae bacterium]|nr:hypothetical protein [Phycisphaerae bacterium]
MERRRCRAPVFIGVCILVGAAGLVVDRRLPALHRLPSGLSWPGLVGILAGVMALCGFFTLLAHFLIARKGKPTVEGVMIGRLYWLLDFLAVLISLAYGFGVLGTFTTAFSLFGGMLLGWSLQVSRGASKQFLRTWCEVEAYNGVKRN